MNWFWAHFFTNLLIPTIMIIASGWLLFFTPQKINSFFGYRTTRSMKNTDTWIYAQKLSGKIMFIIGILVFFITIIIQIPYYNSDDNTISTLGMIITFSQIIIILISIIPVEIALKKKFD